MIVGRVFAVLAGGLVVVWVLWSAIRVVIVPRGEAVWLSRAVFVMMRQAFEFVGRRTRTYQAYDRVMARYAPTSLVVLPLAWAVIVLGAFIPIFWGLGVGSWKLAVTTSGSSFTTLGFDRPPGLPAELGCFLEALIGLFLVALLISYLPSIYGNFSRREALVVKLEVRAGSPPDAETFLTRVYRIRGLEHLADGWEEWEQWFVEVEESHASQPSLPFFRSPRPNSSWITAAGAVLDTAALSLAALDIEPNSQAQITIRAGYLCLRSLSAFFGLPFDPDPAPDAPIAVGRDEFEGLLDRLAEVGLPIKADRDQAWRDFAGWRVNYDGPLLGLSALVSAPPATWSADRVARFGTPRAIRMGRGGTLNHRLD